MTFCCSLSERLRFCIEQRPPLMMLLLCFAALAVAFAAFGTYVGSHDVRNSDIVKDWNTFLQSVTELQFCPNGDLDGSDVMPLNSALRKHVASPLVDHANLNISATSEQWVSISVLVPIVFHSSGVSEPGEGPWRVIMAGHQLGLKGLCLLFFGSVKVSCFALIASCSCIGIHHRFYPHHSYQEGVPGDEAEELINMTVVSHWQRNACEKGQACSKQGTPDSCITFLASASLLPQTRRPPDCSMNNFTNSQILSRTVFASQRANLREGTSCYQANYYPDPSLTIRLSKAERYICKIRLMYASLLLLILTGLVLCFAATCIHPPREKWTRVHL
ncbi:insulin-like growth factor-binding protein 3 receptor isoform X1 [Microcaecilia unicolor]|uniref:Insulin-like growth factor-binding protein 3 receptor isoform X1 n=1 Tax=Microcaecilia unicolor TaxID=1415580 RepID=A0A6P7YQA4_9AMPH|nr:insulin-like growth factor-binding protein 3 receptor isoform X1 [Microcaecilia unicolor]XP_030065430.1 insulin-like growth factor-binding protein 3 receptor isoform X1 [Microcaecilia unicolor]